MKKKDDRDAFVININSISNTCKMHKIVYQYKLQLQLQLNVLMW